MLNLDVSGLHLSIALCLKKFCNFFLSSLFHTFLHVIIILRQLHAWLWNKIYFDIFCSENDCIINYTILSKPSASCQAFYLLDNNHVITYMCSGYEQSPPGWPMSILTHLDCQYVDNLIHWTDVCPWIAQSCYWFLLQFSSG